MNYLRFTVQFALTVFAPLLGAALLTARPCALTVITAIAIVAGVAFYNASWCASLYEQADPFGSLPPIQNSAAAHDSRRSWLVRPNTTGAAAEQVSHPTPTRSIEP